jgi:hypothetical protein
MSPTVARKLTARIRSTPGDGHQPARVGPVERVVRDRAPDQRDLAVEEVDLAQAAVGGLALLDRQLELGQALPPRASEQIADRRAALQAPHQDRMDLVLGPGTCADQLRAARRPTAHRPCALVRHAHAVQRPRGQSRSAPRSGPHPPRRSRPHRSHGAHPTQLPSPSLPASTATTCRENCGPTTPTATGSVAGVATDKLGLNDPSTHSGLPTFRSPDGPESSPRTVSPTPDGAVDVQFHPPRMCALGKKPDAPHTPGRHTHPRVTQPPTAI